jgi:AmmeMemoRadiSam system protein B
MGPIAAQVSRSGNAGMSEACPRLAERHRASAIGFHLGNDESRIVQGQSKDMRRAALGYRILLLWLLWAAACNRQKVEAAQTNPTTGLRPQSSSPMQVSPRSRVREPAVAGSFYPAEPARLAKEVDDLLAQAGSRNLKGLRALLSPHAGYRYSGSVAASGYKQLVGLGFERVLIMAPSHHVPFAGVAVPDADALRTPLGDVTVSPQARELAQQAPFVVDSEPHAREHSLEVQLPFLQRTLHRFQVVPLVFGEVNEEQVARRLESTLGDRTLVIASSDLSHYYPYEKARLLDRATLEAIVRLDIEALARGEACGRSPILALLHIARERGWRAELLDARNSGDTTEDRSRVVGYASVAFLEGVP